MKKIIIAPNAFKDSLSATEAAECIKRGLVASALKADLKTVPIGDGGDGTARLIAQALDGEWISCRVSDPLGKSLEADFNLIEEGNTAVVEMAEASGLKLLEPEKRNPLKTTSEGTGELIKVALDHGVKKIILGVGGSATVDGGCGILHALSVHFRDGNGQELRPVPEELIDFKKVDFSSLDPRLKGMEIRVLCDVQNSLLGDQGAAVVFGPQKGASPENVQFLERFLKKWSLAVKQHFNKDISIVRHGGAAGGVAAGLWGVLNARLEDGITSFLEIIGFEKHLQDADLVITGEGSLDEQTLNGKGPMGVAQLAKKYGIPCIGLAGKIPQNPSPELKEMFTALFSINPELADLKTALKNTSQNLERMGEQIGNILRL